MRNLPSGLAAHLAARATTLCHCWRLIRRDGVVMGFTDHDRDLAFEGVTFRASSGLEAAEAGAELGFAVASGEVSGALTAADITEEDCTAGLYDNAGITLWLVNWANVEERVILDVAEIGEIRRTEQGFIAETRGLMHRLDEERGRLYRAACSADLGDARCGLTLASPLYKAEGVSVTATDGRLGLSADTLASFADGWFTGGRLTWVSGANAGLSIEVKAHRQLGYTAELDLWLSTPNPIAPGDTFDVQAGCDKSFATCKAKFNNALNFRGFPHMPGNDYVIRPVKQGEGRMDGGSLFR